MTPAEFAAIHVEFAPIVAQHPTWVTATLANVERYVSDSWGDARDEIVALECAARLAVSPIGRAAQLSAKDGESTYSIELKRRRAINACGPARIA